MPSFDYTKILIKAEDSLRHAIEVINAGSIQIALVVDDSGRLKGTVTDGDIRRGILQGVSLDEPVGKVMHREPLTLPIGTAREEVLALMTARTIKQVPLLDRDGRVKGLELLDRLLRGPEAKASPVVILAGGQGMRLRPLTNDTPKPLLKVGDRPVLELILQQLRAYGFHRVFISVNYLGSQIEDYLGDGRRHGVSIEYLRERVPLGTAGPLALMPNPLHFPCVVVNGDLLTKVNFEQLLEFHREGGFDMTVGVKEWVFQAPFGLVETRGDEVVGFKEKPTESRLINAGVYVLEPEILDMVPENAYCDMDQVLEKVIGAPGRRLGAFLIHEYWMDIGTDADYRKARGDYKTHFDHA